MTDRATEWLLAIVPVLLAAAALFFLLNPNVPAASINQPLDIVIDTVASLVAVAVAGLGWVHFQESRDAAPLLRAAAFLTLGALNAMLVLVMAAGLSPAFGLDVASPGQLPVLVTVVGRGTASAILVLVGLAGMRGWQARAWPSLLVLWVPALAVVAVAAIAAAAQDSLPRLLGPAELTALRVEPTAPLVVFGARVLVGLQVAIGLGFLAAAALSYRVFRRDSRSLDAFLTAGLVIAAFSQVQFAIHPGIYGGLVTLGDLERVAFFLVMFVALAAESRDEARALRQANAELVILREADLARATADERARLAREIHDGMSQELWFAKLKQARLAGLDLPAEAHALASEVAGALDAALAEARQAILALRPTEEASFAAVLERFVADFSDRFGIHAECECDPVAEDLPPRAKAELLRIAQEALANARRHADATVVTVRVTAGAGAVQLTVSDNGHGFDPAVARDSGYGLRSMRERAELIGGRLTVDTGLQEGTRVTVELPVEAAR
jgi:signal transduction histidine kinase